MWPTILITVYCILIAAASLAGGYLPSVLRLTHTRLQVMMSFVGGLMLGVAVLHLLPHAVAQAGSLDVVVRWALAGLLTMFFLMRISHFHQHEHHEDGPEAGHDHTSHSGHDVHHEQMLADDRRSKSTHQFSWLGLFFGLALHTLIDGVALAASVAVQEAGHTAAGLIGAGTFLAIVAHKPLDALSITTLMVSAGWPRRWIQAINVTFALMCPVGAMAFYHGIQGSGDMRGTVVGWALGFAAGVFLCISLADILPELQFHRHDRLTLSASLLLGVLLAFAIGYLEPPHEHHGTEGPGGTGSQHRHTEH